MKTKGSKMQKHNPSMYRKLIAVPFGIIMTAIPGTLASWVVAGVLSVDLDICLIFLGAPVSIILLCWAVPYRFYRGMANGMPMSALINYGYFSSEFDRKYYQGADSEDIDFLYDPAFSWMKDNIWHDSTYHSSHRND